MMYFLRSVTLPYSRIKRILPLSCLNLLCPLLIACSPKPSSEPPATPKAALTVEAISPTLEPWPQRIAASGNIQPWQEATIGTEISGLKLNRVLVNVGDTVQRGQLLAQFNEETVKAEIQQQNAALAEAQANLLKAKSDLERAHSLESTGAISQQEIMQYRTAVKTSQAKLASVKAQQTNQQLRLRYTHVVAPAKGIISSRTATVGAVLSAGSELFKLIIDSRLEWRAEVPSDALLKLHPGLKVDIHAPGKNSIAFPSTTGTVRQVAPLVSTDTRNGLVYVDIPASSPLKAGMFVSGDILLSKEPALSVPESSIIVRDGYHYVMKIDSSHHIHQIKVSTGRRQHDRVELLENISSSTPANTISTKDRLVLNGGNFLANGDLVNIVSTSTPPSSSAGAQ